MSEAIVDNNGATNQPTFPLARVDEKPHSLMRRATDAADACREIVLRTAMELQGKKYVKVEGWASIAAVYGCTPTIREVVEDERGVRAVADLKTHDGRIIASAEGFCGVDEPRWATQPMYARRGMAQTRAVSRVCRTAFAFVVTLIDSGLQTTPAEEIPVAGEVVPTEPVAAVAQPAAAQKRQGERSRATEVKFGRQKGVHLCDLARTDLEWHLAAAAKAVEGKHPQYHEQNVEWLKNVQAEIQARSQK